MSFVYKTYPRDVTHKFSPIYSYYYYFWRITYENSVALVRKRTIPTEQQPLVDEVSANTSG
jgi:hypothetical protein